MKQFITLTVLLISLSGTSLFAQTTIDFESFGLEADTFLNGSDLSGGFSTENIFLKNDYSVDFDSWVGWSISTMRDTITPGFTNQYAAITGSGANGSATYAVGYDFSGSNVITFTDSTSQIVEGFFITNSTYAYLSMLNGDSFAKRFGGESGDDPDFFLLSLRGYKDGALTADSVSFYLADYRFENNEEDYIVDEWTFVELAALGAVDSLSFVFYSSDEGSFGINTPLYFCVDDIQLMPAISSSTTPGLSSSLIPAYPNPFRNSFTIGWEESRSQPFTILNLQGQVIKKGILEPGENLLELRNQPEGIYYLMVGTKAGAIKLIKS
ncbi:MAG: DUF4465 domain-containing protein [Bacteroidota bacterium]